MKPRSLGICNDCGVRPIEGGADVTYLYGLLQFVYHGTKRWETCTPCHRRRALEQLVLTSLFGWWCFPHGLATPVVLIQNIGVLFDKPSPEKLAAWRRADQAWAEDNKVAARLLLQQGRLDSSIERDGVGGVSIIVRPLQKPHSTHSPSFLVSDGRNRSGSIS